MIPASKLPRGYAQLRLANKVGEVVVTDAKQIVQYFNAYPQGSGPDYIPTTSIIQCPWGMFEVEETLEEISLEIRRAKGDELFEPPNLRDVSRVGSGGGLGGEDPES